MVYSDKTINKQSKDIHTNNIFRVFQYCENLTECRRQQLLAYFGETGFDPTECRENLSTICDNCSCVSSTVQMDITDCAKDIVKSVNKLVHHNNNNWRKPQVKITLERLVDVFMVCILQRS